MKNFATPDQHSGLYTLLSSLTQFLPPEQSLRTLSLFIIRDLMRIHKGDVEKVKASLKVEYDRQLEEIPNAVANWENFLEELAREAKTQANH